MAIISAERLTKVYHLYKRFSDRIIEAASWEHLNLSEAQYAIYDVSFEIGVGEAFGIVGENGAGKSTLLKLLAGITQPSSGTLVVNGSVSTLIDLGSGFRKQFTGRENIKLNCSIMGMHPKEIEEKTEEIIAFAELDKQIDHKLFTYSNGMVMRLGFAVAVSLASDIVLIDEVIAVGDEYFQRKCIEKVKEMLASGTTIIIVSHNLHLMKNLCNRVLWLEKNQTKMLGSADQVIEKYIRTVNEEKINKTVAYEDTKEEKKQASEAPKIEMVGNAVAKENSRGQGVTFAGITINGISDPQAWNFNYREAIEISVSFKTAVELVDPVMGIALFSGDCYLFGPNTKHDNCLKGKYLGEYTYTLKLTDPKLLRGTYQITIAIFDKEHVFHYLWLDRAFSFSIKDETGYDGLCALEHQWFICKKDDK